VTVVCKICSQMVTAAPDFSVDPKARGQAEWRHMAEAMRAHVGRYHRPIAGALSVVLEEVARYLATLAAESSDERFGSRQQEALDRVLDMIRTAQLVRSVDTVEPALAGDDSRNGAK